MSDQIAVSCTGVGKTFRIPTSQERTLRGRLLHPTSRTTHEEFTAIDKVDVEVREGEFFGIVGRNGSGKSTLLKVLAGIYKADRGSVQINGSIAPFIELGVGFNEDLSARDNVFINGAILGMSRKQILDRFDAIVDFAELHQFMEMRLRNFSSGMLMRLAFAIAVQSGADVLLIDEVLAVGDGRFQRKCHEVFRERKRRGETVIFVSHDMNAIEAFCDRALLLDKGKQIALGAPAQIVPLYHDLNRPLEHGTDSIPQKESTDATPVLLERFELATNAGEAMEEWGAEETLNVAIGLRCDQDVPGTTVRILVTNEGGGLIGAVSTLLGDTSAGDARTINFAIENILGAGNYGLEVEVHGILDGRPQSVADPRRRDIRVGGDRTVGAIRLPFAVRESAGSSTTTTTS